MNFFPSISFFFFFFPVLTKAIRLELSLGISVYNNQHKSVKSFGKEVLYYKCQLMLISWVLYKRALDLVIRTILSSVYFFLVSSLPTCFSFLFLSSFDFLATVLKPTASKLEGRLFMVISVALIGACFQKIQIQCF